MEVKSAIDDAKKTMRYLLKPTIKKKINRLKDTGLELPRMALRWPHQALQASWNNQRWAQETRQLPTTYLTKESMMSWQFQQKKTDN